MPCRSMEGVGTVETVIHDFPGAAKMDVAELCQYVMYPNTGTVHKGPTLRECAACVWTAIMINV